MNGFLNRRVRGFRLIDLVAFSVLAALILGVYLAKTIAGRERTEIARIDRQIDDEKARIRLLQAEVSHLEEPQRIERLSEAYLGLAPAPMKHQASLSDLPALAGKPLAPPAKPFEASVDPLQIAVPQPASPLPQPTQMAAAVQPATGAQR